MALGATNANLSVADEIKAAFTSENDTKPRAIKIAVDTEAEKLVLAASHPDSGSGLAADFKAVASMLEEGIPCLVLIRLEGENDCALLAWTPSDSPVKLRMLCASSRKTLRNEFEKLSFKEYNATEKAEVTLDQFMESTRSRTEEDRHAAMTQEELDHEEVRRQVAEERAAAPKKLAGLAALQVKVQPSFDEAVERLLGAAGEIAVCAQLSGEKGEEVTAEVLESVASVSGLRGRLPIEKPCYAVIRRSVSNSGGQGKAEESEGDATETESKPQELLFISWLPENSEVKARMKCSTFKASVVDRIKELAGRSLVMPLSEVTCEEELTDKLGESVPASNAEAETESAPKAAPPTGSGYGAGRPPPGAFALPGMGGPGGLAASAALAAQLKTRPNKEASNSTKESLFGDDEKKQQLFSEKEPETSQDTASVPAPAPSAPAPVPAPTPAVAPASASAAPAAAAPAAPAPAAASPGVFYSLAELQDSSFWKEKGIPAQERETFLDDATFSSLFGCSKDDFAKLPKWKREQRKKPHGLF
eukprot:TRINITY_DN11635_c0_g1_i1.p1 TRINITY_DN11635_c0_g1~~TRINITY_DN11635_c0_g1_i1.p1  ORF type:complete len:561 (-),score=166.50 TRINITY_DN11635_c0_g1_i1:143-1744(-)